MPHPEETRNDPIRQVQLDRTTFIRSGMLAARALTALGGSAITVLRHFSTTGIGYQMHHQYGHPLGTSELHDRVHRFFQEIHVPDPEWRTRYDTVYEAINSGDDSSLLEARALWNEKERRFGFEATYARIFVNDAVTNASAIGTPAGGHATPMRF